jgi:predicted ATP-dependent serine protease
MGGVGVTVLAGQPKVGKSLMSLSCGIESAKAGWRVIYVNAEMSRAHIGLRLLNYMGKIDPQVASRMKIANVTTGITIDGLYDEIEKEVEPTDTKLLIILDSINRIVDMGQSEGGENAYWRLLRDWSAWAMNSRRSTEGRIGWLIVSELAAQGHVKGRSLEYLADVVIRLNSTDVPDVIDVDIPYSRSTRSGSIGALFRDFARGIFIKGV